jgi:hypothetical protein
MSVDPDQIFGDRDAPTLDKAIASSVIAQYVSGKLQTLAGHFEAAEPNQYASRYQKWGGSKLPVQKVPGYTDRNDKDKPIKLMTSGNFNKEYLKGATFEAAVHETIHLNSNHPLFENQFGHNYNEGVTEYFTLKVFGVQTGKAYPDELALAKGLVTAFSERDVAAAYFKDQAHNLFARAYRAFGNSSGNPPPFVQWQLKSKTDDPKDWKEADRLLQTAVANPAARGSGADSASAGSGSRP